MKKTAVFLCLVLLVSGLAAATGVREGSSASDQIQVQLERTLPNFIKLKMIQMNDALNPFDYEAPDGVTEIG